MGNAINGTVNHQVGETIKGDAPSPIIKAIQAGHVQNHRTHGRISYPSDPDLYALFDPVPPPPRIRLRTHWRLRIAFHVIGRRASNPRSKRHELGLYRVSDIASFLLPGE